MLYYLLQIFEKNNIFPGIRRLCNYISFRAALAAILSLSITIIFGKIFIGWLIKKKIKNDIRVDNIIQDNEKKKNTPTMGGLLIMIATLVPTFIFSALNNIYIILLIITTLLMSLIGFIDDYIKVYKNYREGIHPRIKLFGQFFLGVIVGSTLYFHKDVVIRKFENIKTLNICDLDNKQNIEYKDVKSTKTNVPFFKNNELDYTKIIKKFLPGLNEKYTSLIYILFIIFIISSVSNGCNLTDGLDGLAAGVSAIVGFTLAILSYLSGNIIFSNYLNILYIPGSGELAIFCVAFVSACIGFLWYNAYPSMIIMGDTGSLMLGGVIAVLAISIRKELLIPILCGIFLIENLSVILQVVYFKITKKLYGKGKRIFKMAPLHHHFQQKGIHESKIVVRFFIVSILLAILTLTTLKVR